MQSCGQIIPTGHCAYKCLFSSLQTTGCVYTIPETSPYAQVTLIPAQQPNPRCNPSTVISLLQSVSDGNCVNWIWIMDPRIGVNDILNETTIECVLPNLTPGSSVSTSAEGW